MIEPINLRRFKQFGPGRGTAVCLGNQKPAYDSGFRSVDELFASLGYQRVFTLDYNGAGSHHVDLNYPGPLALEDSADLIYDGGTSEHVANIGQSFVNILRLARVGCVIYQEVPINCYGGSYYGIDPMLLRDFYKLNGVQQLFLVIEAKRALRTRIGWLLRIRWPRVYQLAKRLFHIPLTAGLMRSLSENHPASIRHYSADIVAYQRKVPLKALVVFVGRVMARRDNITWPAQHDYPRASPLCQNHVQESRSTRRGAVTAHPACASAARSYPRVGEHFRPG